MIKKLLVATAVSAMSMSAFAGHLSECASSSSKNEALQTVQQLIYGKSRSTCGPYTQGECKKGSCTPYYDQGTHMEMYRCE